MVTSAAYADVTGDDNNDLIIAGEWMGVRVFSFVGGKFVESKSSLADLHGWWQSLSAADLNNDGKMDLVLGNIGENFYLQPSTDKPVKLWVADFDKSGDQDKLLTYAVEGVDKPVFLKNDIQEQVPGIKKENLKHHDYALKSISQLFPLIDLKQTQQKTFNYASSIVALNNGNGSFEIKKLPVRGQLSCINAIMCKDVNGDGKIDLVTGGNRSGFPPQLQKLDASYGDVFINNGRGDFSWQGPLSTGLKVDGEIRDIIELEVKGQDHVLFLRNNDYAKMFRLNIAEKN